MMEERLKELKLKRDYPVGKRMGSDVWIHKSVAKILLLDRGYNVVKAQLPDDFDFEVVRYNKKTGEMTFIASPDFDTSDEPIVGDSYTVLKSDKGYQVKLNSAAENNPLIWHHKWMMVNDDYDGFDVELSKKRSIEWKTILGVNKELSSRIGRLDFWKKWLKEVNMGFNDSNKGIVMGEDPFDVYYSQKTIQSVDSAATARNQKPKTLSVIEKLKVNLQGKKVLDIGCGRQNEKSIEFFENAGAKYFGIDPYNQSRDINLRNIEQCRDGQSDIVVLNNVLNVIPFEEKDVYLNILNQAKNALVDNGEIFICIYEGAKTSKEKKLEEETGEKVALTPISTRDGFQNRMKTLEYLPIIQSVFPNAEIKSGIIVAKKEDPKPAQEISGSAKKLKVKV